MINADNLVAIAYKTGFCGTLMYYLLSHSPEVAQYRPLVTPTFNDGTSHENKEDWFRGLHDYSDSLTVSEQNWESYQTVESRQALAQDKLVVFRCHPNTVFRLSFLKNLRVLYMTHSNNIVCERWAYEKVYKKDSDYYFEKSFRNRFKSNPTVKINNVFKRQFLLDNIYHDVKTVEQCEQVHPGRLFKVQLERLLSNDYFHYCEICDFLNLTPIVDTTFNTIIDLYNSKQWKRF